MAREITLYSKKPCVQCDATKRKLKALGVDFEKDGDVIVLGESTYILADATTDENRQVGIDLGYMQAPVVTVKVDGELESHWSGYDPDKIQANVVEVLV